MSTPFAEALRRAREKRGYKKAELARKMGITGPAISQWESGATSPEPFRFAQLVDLLHIDPSEEPFAEYTLFVAGVNPGEDIRNMYPQDMAKLRNAFVHGGSFSRSTEIAPSSSLDLVVQEKDKSPYALIEAKRAPAFKSIQGLARDIPVYGIAVGGEDGDFQFNGTEADRVTRPPGLANARDIFALYVVNDSMYPAWREGALFYVNPHRPPVIGDDVVVEMKPQVEGEAGAAFLKRLKARRGNTIVVEQFNPPKEIEFDRDAVRLYRVIPWEEALGLS
jgi:phage repressor protein C with HTH and peptisase S24 domain